MNSKFLLLIFCSLTTFANAWDRQGHQWVAQIAWHYMTPEAKKQVAKQLYPENIVSVSDWADRIRNTHRFTSWHYQTMATPTAAPKTPGHLIDGIERCIDQLTHPSHQQMDIKEALKLLIHLIGDLHQPLHVGNGHDRGANRCYVHWFKRKNPISLHRIWDHFLIANLAGTQKDFISNSSHIAPDVQHQWQKGSLIQWAQESRAMHDQIYPRPIRYCTFDKKPPKSYMPRLKQKYVSTHLPLVKLRIRQAGIRLAYILNSIYPSKGSKTPV